MHPQPLFSLGDTHVYAYGVCYAAGIILCFIFLMVTMWKKKFNEAATDVILIIGVEATGFGILSAMLFQSTYNFISNPSAGFKLNGSMTFIGGLIGGVLFFLVAYWLYVYLLAPRTKIRLLQNNMNAGLTDALPFIPIGIAIAHSLGRLGCLFGGCCYGVEATDGLWGLPAAAPHGVQLDTLVVPTQLYECLFLAALACLMAVLYFRHGFNYNFAIYLMLYGVWRLLLEFVRGDSRGELLPWIPLYPSQIWSLVMIVAGVGYIFLQKYLFAKHMKHPEREAETTAA